MPEVVRTLRSSGKRSSSRRRRTAVAAVLVVASPALQSGITRKKGILSEFHRQHALTLKTNRKNDDYDTADRLHNFAGCHQPFVSTAQVTQPVNDLLQTRVGGYLAE